MDSPQAKDVIKEAYMMGSDEGTPVTNRKFAGTEMAEYLGIPPIANVLNIR